MPPEIAGLTEAQLLAIPKEAKLTDAFHATSPWMTPEETATYLGIALGTLRNWTSARFIPFSKRGRVVRYHRETIDKWLSKGSCSGRTTLADV
jgi:excisionase family DNA binding protein